MFTVVQHPGKDHGIPGGSLPGLDEEGRDY